MNWTYPPRGQHGALVFTGMGVAALAAHLALMQAPRVTPAANDLHVGPAPSDRTAPSLFKAYCAGCHGAAMAGDGRVASRLAAPVPDLRGGMKHFSGTGPRGHTVADVAWVVERGVPGTAMAAYGDLLSKPEIQALARHVVTLVKGDLASPLVDVGAAPEVTPDVVMEGAAVYARAGCASCHGLQGTSGPEPAWKDMKNTDGTTPRWPRLDRPFTWRGGSSARDIAVRVATGIPGTPMGAYRPSLKDRELLALGAYVETMGAGVTPDVLLKEALDAPPPTDLVADGKRLLATMACTTCHADAARPTQVNLGPLGSYFAASMLPASDGGLAGAAGSPERRAAVREQLVAALVEGTGADGRRLHPLAMPWPLYKDLTAAQLDALAAALAEDAPGGAPVPPRNAGWLEQVVGKLSAVTGLIVLERQVGAPAEDESGGPPAMVVAGGAAAATGALVFFLLFVAAGGPKRSRRKRTLVALVPLPVGALLSVILAWPAYELRPAFAIRSAMGGELPEPAGLDGDALRAAQWGRQLVTAAGCASCHTAQDPFRLRAAVPLSGGVRVRGAAFGRVHAGNLTPDATGILGVTSAQFRRALKAGVGRDGRLMHPDAMPFTATSGWTEAEMDAVHAYLKALPAHAAPRPAGVGGGDDFNGVAVGLFQWE